MGNESAIIYIGPERKRYLIHKDLLTKQSEFFDRALNGKFKEAEENSIYLEEESPAAFDLLVGWLYQGRIPVIGPPFGGFKAPEVDTTDKDPMTPGIVLQLEHSHGTSFRRLVGPYPLPTVDVRMVMKSPVTPPKNEGTGQVAYQPHTETSTSSPSTAVLGAIDQFEHISAQKEYHRWSPEELRAVDYTFNKKWDFLQSVHQLASQSDSDIDSTASDLHDSRTSALGKLTAPAPFTHKGHLPGIPHSSPLSALTTIEEAHQIALLHLCLLSETLCWSTLFNYSMSAYLLGEATLSHRPLPTSHIALIYNRAHASSPCRAFAADSAVSHLWNPVAQGLYAELSREYPQFLEDMFASLGANPALRLRDPTRRAACVYHVHAAGESCSLASLDLASLGKGNASVDLFGKKPGDGFMAGLVDGDWEVREGRAGGSGQQTYTRAWMDWGEMRAWVYRGLGGDF